MKLAGSVKRPDGARLRFQLEGPRNAPPVFLLQGQANSHRWWNPIRRDFTRDFLTITLDYRGTGKSSVATHGPEQQAQWNTAHFAHDVAAVLSATGIPRVDVYATSMGGRIAQHLATQQPELVRRLVLACTSPGGHLAAERSPHVRKLLAQPDAEARRRAMIDLFYRPSWVQEQGGHEHVPADLLGDPTMTREARAGHLRTSNSHDATDVLGNISAPTLIVHGTDDVMTPAINAERLAEAVPGARMQLFPGGRHGFFHDMHDVVTPAVLEHLGRR